MATQKYCRSGRHEWTEANIRHDGHSERCRLCDLESKYRAHAKDTEEWNRVRRMKAAESRQELAALRAFAFILQKSLPRETYETMMRRAKALASREDKREEGKA